MFRKKHTDYHYWNILARIENKHRTFVVGHNNIAAALQYFHSEYPNAIIVACDKR